jgi:hypothetical protein
LNSTQYPMVVVCVYDEVVLSVPSCISRYSLGVHSADEFDRACNRDRILLDSPILLLSMESRCHTSKDAIITQPPTVAAVEKKRCQVPSGATSPLVHVMRTYSDVARDPQVHLHHIDDVANVCNLRLCRYH